MAGSQAGNGEEEGVIELAPNSLTHSCLAVLFNPFLSSPAPRPLVLLMALFLFPFSLPCTLRRAVAGCEIECHGLKTALENVSIVNCSRRSYKKSRRRSPSPSRRLRPFRRLIPRSRPSPRVRLSIGKKGRWKKIFHASYAREVWPMKL